MRGVPAQAAASAQSIQRCPAGSVEVDEQAAVENLEAVELGMLVPRNQEEGFDLVVPFWTKCEVRTTKRQCGSTRSAMWLSLFVARQPVAARG